MSGDETGLTINKDYANKYNTWRQKEEFQKLKDRYGDVDAFSEGSGSSSSETEDEDAEALTSKLETNWLKTLAALKSKDPKIYNKNVVFFEPEEGIKNDPKAGGKSSLVQGKKKQAKPFTIKDYERKLIMEKEGRFVDEDGEGSSTVHRGADRSSYFEEQEQLRKSIKDATKDEDESNSDSELLKARGKSKEEEDLEETEYRKWLMGQKSSVDDTTAKELEPLKQYCENAQLNDGEKYLWDYILNKRYTTKDEEGEVPTYDEIVRDDVDLSEEEVILEKQETFERKYNFRFEEPDPEFIKNYPRAIEDSVRRIDTRRAEKRKDDKERKEQEKDKRRTELTKLKNLKRKELLDKVTKLKETSGQEYFDLNERELDEEFDPTKHDQIMSKMFGNEYYGEAGEEQKPEFEYDPELDTEDWDNWTGPPVAQASHGNDEAGSTETGYYQEASFNMDADFDPSAAPQVKLSKKKRRNRFADSLSKEKPPFDPKDKSFEDYLNEYYKLDYEDIIGDMPVRFKYRSVVANDFGLSTEEVLVAREKELNAWCSLKKTAQYRTEEEELADKRIYLNKAKNTTKKLRIIPSIAGESSAKSVAVTLSPDDQDNAVIIEADSARGITESHRQPAGNPAAAKKKKKKKGKSTETAPGANAGKTRVTPSCDHSSEKLNSKAEQEASDSAGVAPGEVKQGSSIAEKKKKKSKKRKFTAETISDERLKAYGFNPKKFKYLAKSRNQSV